MAPCRLTRSQFLFELKNETRFPTRNAAKIENKLLAFQVYPPTTVAPREIESTVWIFATRKRERGNILSDTLQENKMLPAINTQLVETNLQIFVK